MAAVLAKAATSEATRAAMQEAARAISLEVERMRVSQGSHGMGSGDHRSTTSGFGHSWPKAADEIGLPRLGKKSTFSAFCTWRSTAERWACSVGAEMGALPPLDVADAAPRLLLQELFQELLVAGKVEASWE